MMGKGAHAPFERGTVMRKRSLAAALAACATLSGCVQTQQYADVQFTPPSGNYKLLVLRPDVTVGSITTGGMVQPRAVGRFGELQALQESILFARVGRRSRPTRAK